MDLMPIYLRVICINKAPINIPLISKIQGLNIINSLRIQKNAPQLKTQP